jgi:hypothetical protein
LIAMLAFCGAGLLCSSCSTAVRTGKQAYFFIQSELTRSSVRIVLDRAFVDQYADRVTIDTSFTVDRAGRFAHATFLDGDLHVAGRSAQIGLPVVAEVENAAHRPDVVAAIQGAAGSGSPVPLTGVWRVWSEHGSAEKPRDRSSSLSTGPIRRTSSRFTRSRAWTDSTSPDRSFPCGGSGPSPRGSSFEA